MLAALRPDIIPAVYAIQRADPEHAATILINGADTIIADTGWVSRIVVIDTERIVIGVPLIQTRVGGDPQAAVAILKDTAHSIVAETAR